MTTSTHEMEEAQVPELPRWLDFLEAVITALLMARSAAVPMRDLHLALSEAFAAPAVAWVDQHGPWSKSLMFALQRLKRLGYIDGWTVRSIAVDARLHVGMATQGNARNLASYVDSAWHDRNQMRITLGWGPEPESTPTLLDQV